MTAQSAYLKQMAVQWRELAAVGDPARRDQRERWAAALEQMAELKASDQETVVLPGAEEKNP